VVSDQWQHRGIAHHLMSKLIEVARDRGIERMDGEVLSNNHKMLELVKGLGFKVRNDPDDIKIKQVELRLL